MVRVEVTDDEHITENVTVKMHLAMKEATLVRYDETLVRYDE